MPIRIYYISLFFSTLFFITFDAFAQKNRLHLAHYNVENLFDTINDPQVQDEDFLPDGNLQWTTERYLKKQSDLAKVIKTMNKGNGPDLLGLCEIENRLVLNELNKNLSSKNKKYHIAHFESPDKRGIDVALLYNPKVFKSTKALALPVIFEGDDPYPTRDILLVSGVLSNKTRLHVFVNHWPSRRGGQEASEKNRIAAAGVVRKAIDSLLQLDPKAHVVVMGDFNDGPLDHAPRMVMGADSLRTPDGFLYNPFIALSADSSMGSYRFRGNWQFIDHISFSTNVFLPHSKLRYVEGSAGPVFFDFLLEQEGRFQGNPWRTYAGNRYLGGFSDHLPVQIEFELVK
ncbi:MAG: endonuclease/exonuclease/phosphatase family protein [Bacteroidia bacterium]